MYVISPETKTVHTHQAAPVPSILLDDLESAVLQASDEWIGTGVVDVGRNHTRLHGNDHLGNRC